MMNLVLVGACYLDTILSVDHFPEEDSKLRASDLHRRRGGNVTNSLEVLLQLLPRGRRLTNTKLCTVLPSTSSSAFAEIKSSFGVEIDHDCCIFRESCHEAASSYIIRSTSSGSRTIVNYNGLEEMSLSEFRPIVDRTISEDCWYHFEGRNIDAISKGIKYIRKNSKHAIISVEIEKPGRDGLESLAAASDVCFYSKTWVSAKGFRSAEEFIEQNVDAFRNKKLVVCTWGEAGSVAIEGYTGIVVKAEPFFQPHACLVDSTGAGDTFIAGVLFGLLCQTGWNLSDTMNFASELAGRKVTREGFGGLAEAMPMSYWE